MLALACFPSRPFPVEEVVHAVSYSDVVNGGSHGMLHNGLAQKLDSTDATHVEGNSHRVDGADLPVMPGAINVKL
ncbi:hypothetical protein A0H81_05418 [Grifola frondosa]|uniref:Uncharacterized protein n=1 Tax=Grifola frondosa TaxID=5627 RepID=A0A1C7MDI4_GRIFR|nr:hypothetical protein A0H81_05418 [Grifola frondosa]